MEEMRAPAPSARPRRRRRRPRKRPRPRRTARSRARWREGRARRQRRSRPAARARPRHPRSPRFRAVLITFEGIDRSGKTTQARMLADALGDKALLVREPGGTPAAERIRELVKDPAVELSPITETLLFGAARAELVATVIRPALAAGKIGDLRPLHRLDGRLPGWRAGARDRTGRGAQPVDHPRPRAPT